MLDGDKKLHSNYINLYTIVNKIYLYNYRDKITVWY